MMRLYVRAVLIEDRYYRVYWSTSKIEGSGQKGVLGLTIPSHLSHPDSRAEISALRHLLFIENIFGRDPDPHGNILASGIGLHFSFGSEDIVKISEQDSDIKNLGRAAYLLRHRLDGALIEHSVDMTPFEEVLAENPKDIDNPSPMLDFLITPEAGLISITHHAVDRYIQFMEKNENITKIKRPRESLLKRFCTQGFSRVEVDNDILVQKTINHGSSDDLEFWGHPGSRIQFTVIRDKNGVGNVVTAYIPKKKEYSSRTKNPKSGKK